MTYALIALGGVAVLEWVLISKENRNTRRLYLLLWAACLAFVWTSSAFDWLPLPSLFLQSLLGWTDRIKLWG